MERISRGLGCKKRGYPHRHPKIQVDSIVSRGIGLIAIKVVREAALTDRTVFDSIRGHRRRFDFRGRRRYRFDGGDFIFDYHRVSPILDEPSRWALSRRSVNISIALDLWLLKSGDRCYCAACLNSPMRIQGGGIVRYDVEIAAGYR